MPQIIPCDILVIGTGAAGLSAALSFRAPTRVALLSKGSISAGATTWAQGGIAAVEAREDSLDAHIADTLTAGAGLCDPEAVRSILSDAPKAVHWLRDLGVPFTREGAAWDLTREGGHSANRIWHVHDATGRAISETLQAAVREAQHITVYENRLAVDLVIQSGQCVGAYVFDKTTQTVQTFSASAVILATGGASKAYLYCTNPDVASGDGMAMAYRAGAALANLEMNQFHPTCLYHSEARAFLLTEALRGEGGHLINAAGERFLLNKHPLAELAPRDIVARAIDAEMKRLGEPCMYLDVRHLGREVLSTRFPTIVAGCQRLGIEVASQPIPVVPAAHYSCGGIVTDLNGQTTLSGLYAIGETAWTGLHGANRLASNSLVECVVMAERAAAAIQAHTLNGPSQPPPLWDASRVSPPVERVTIRHNWDEVRRTMVDYVGIVRSDALLRKARRRLETIRQEVMQCYEHHELSADLIELRHLVEVALLMVASAQARRESRGLHYTVDCPNATSTAKNTILRAERLRKPSESGTTATKWDAVPSLP